MKFLVPNYSCLQNPWLGGYRPQIPVLSVLCPQLNLLNPLEQNSWVRHCVQTWNWVALQIRTHLTTWRQTALTSRLSCLPTRSQSVWRHHGGRLIHHDQLFKYLKPLHGRIQGPVTGQACLSSHCAYICAGMNRASAALDTLGKKRKITLPSGHRTAILSPVGPLVLFVHLSPVVTSGVPRGGWGVQTPVPKFWRPSKIVPTSTRLWKL